MSPTARTTALALISMILVTTAANAQTKPPKLTPPKDGPIPVAFVLTDSATMIDFAGPWEVFQDVMLHVPGAEHRDAFQLFTVSDSRKPIRTTGGMTVVPEYTFADAPPARIVVVGAQGGTSPEMMEWLRRSRKESDIVMSVCTGAFKLARAGLLDGKTATTHHDFYDRLATNYPKVKVVKGKRFVQVDDKVFTAGGLTSGIDLALHVVELYFGREVAQQTADYMEYESTGWKR